jgi:hypothetical protein
MRATVSLEYWSRAPQAIAIAAYFPMSVYFLTPDTGTGADTITHGDDDNASLALGRSIVDQVNGGHPLGTADTVIFGQGTNTAEVDWADWHVTQPGPVLGPTMGLPEPGIWVMLFIGFVGLCAAVFRRGKTNRLASAFGEDRPSLDLSRVSSATSVEGSSRET